MRVSNIAVMAVVARLVSPEEFGIFTLAVVAHAMIVTFAELGIGSAIARNDLDERAIAPTAITMSVGVSAALGGLLAVFAEPVASLLGSEAAAPALRILAISVALSGVFVVPSAQLQREFRQNVIFSTSLVGTVVGAVVLIGLALVGDGAQAFAWSRVAGQLVTGILVIVAVSHRYGPGWSRSASRLLIQFGLPLALANLLSQLIANVDYVYVGHMLSLRDVGLYTLAFNVSSWASSVLGSILNGIVLPAFSTVRKEGGDIPGTLATSVRVVGLIAFPIAALTSGLASPLILTIYGNQWADAAPIVVILSVYGAANAIGQLVANILIASGRTGVLFSVQVVVLIVLVPALWLGISTAGLIGISLVHVFTVVAITIPIYLVSLRRALNVRVLGMLAAGLWPLTAAVAAGGVAYVASHLVAIPIWQLLLGGLCGGALYLLLTWRSLRRYLPRRSQGRRAKWQSGAQTGTEQRP